VTKQRSPSLIEHGTIWQTGMFLAASSESRRAPCGLRGCKNRPAPFHGQMSYKANNPRGSVCRVSLFLSVSVVLLTRATFLCYFVLFLCSVSCLFFLVGLSSASDWLERLVSKITYNVLMGTLNPTHSLTHSLYHAVTTKASISRLASALWYIITGLRALASSFHYTKFSQN